MYYDVKDTVKKAEKHLKRLQAEFERTDNDYATKIFIADERNFQPLKSKLTYERQANKERFEKSIQIAKDRVDAAKERENDDSKALQAQYAQAEQTAKDQALKAWKNAGGDPASFDAAWPEIRKAQLSEAVLQKMKSEISRDGNTFRPSL